MAIDQTNTPKAVILKVAAFLLWTATTALGLLEVVFVHQIFGQLYFILSGFELGSDETFAARYQIGAVRDFSLVIIAAIWLIFFIISTNYHYNYAGQKQSWRLFAWTIGVEVAILGVNFAMPFLIGVGFAIERR